jgi:hypothetical protein
MKPDWKDAPVCSVELCGRKLVAKALCEKHYRRLKKHGSPDVLLHESHDMRHSAEYRTWSHIKGRCLNISDTSFKDYGARGIAICDEWAKSFAKFYQDMGPRPSALHQIDRIDNSKGYEPGNCRWATAAVNNQNRRSTKLVASKVSEIRASKESKQSLAEMYGVSYSQIARIVSGKRWKAESEQRP